MNARPERARQRRGAIAAHTRASMATATGGFSSRLAATLRSIRARDGRTIEIAAEQADLDVRHYQKLEGGEINATLITLWRLAHGFAVDIADLFAPKPGASLPGAQTPTPTLPQR